MLARRPRNSVTGSDAELLGKGVLLKPDGDAMDLCLVQQGCRMQD
ncbi:MAG: hypothetical protein ACI9BK_001993 [Acidimicrobiales bacterium]